MTTKQQLLRNRLQTKQHQLQEEKKELAYNIERRNTYTNIFYNERNEENQYNLYYANQYVKYMYGVVTDLEKEIQETVTRYNAERNIITDLIAKS